MKYNMFVNVRWRIQHYTLFCVDHSPVMAFLARYDIEQYSQYFFTAQSANCQLLRFPHIHASRTPARSHDILKTDIYVIEIKSCHCT